LLTILKRLRRSNRGLSNVIVVMLSLVLVVIIVGNVVLSSYQMNQFDWQRMQEKTEILDVSVGVGAEFTFRNEGSLTCHLVSLWIVCSAYHDRYDINLYINSGDTVLYVRDDIQLPTKPYIVKVVTEKGNILIYTAN
jgi:hypothetical protein